ncbi:hypothetical protein [Brevundimonas sp. NIBR11]|uniref:hypothetical protein n=1 Tax=Brevundimonas sp. NIBR11 TaxID=3015999 RepID=UPI0022F03D64|nr:hypothetical protein [Brevundimonas sp. NIBR11]WGM29879.1 hypothetical protein KKHFBJBL_00091 [Brevundimonas sp. NIBR11]
MPAWKDWLLGNRGLRDRQRSAVAVAADVWERAGKASTAVLPIMAKVEKLALQVYAEYGLPTQPGHYRRGPSTDGWVFLGEHIDAGMRWSMLLSNPPEQGWRYATLEDIGRFSGAPAELQAASNLLATCRHLKQRLLGREPGEPGDDIETAIRLGVDWRELQDLISWRETSKLKLTTPSDALPSPQPDPGPVPKAAADPEAPAKPPRKPRAPRKKKPV